MYENYSFVFEVVTLAISGLLGEEGMHKLIQL